MNRAKTAFFLILAVAVALAGTLFTSAAEPIGGISCPSEQELAGLEADPDAAIRLRGIEGTWAAVSGITSPTYKGQLDEKIKYIEAKNNRYDDGKFLISEDVSRQEALNTAGIRYMYVKSPVYREMADVTDAVYLASADFTFSKLADRSTSYERWAFYVDRAAVLNLDVSYELSEGHMEVWLVNPDGEVVYQNTKTAKYRENLKLDVDNGLWSIILVNHYSDKHVLRGSKNIQGRILSR